MGFNPRRCDTVESDFIPPPGLKGNPMGLRQSWWPVPLSWGWFRGGCAGLSAASMVPPPLPSKSRNHASQEHCLCPVPDYWSQEELRATPEDGVIPLDMVGTVQVGRWEIPTSFLAQTWGITHLGVSGYDLSGSTPLIFKDRVSKLCSLPALPKVVYALNSVLSLLCPEGIEWL